MTPDPPLSGPVESREEKWLRHMGWMHRARTAIILADQEQAELWAERDRARDLAAHALAIEPLDDETDFAAGYNEARSDFRAVLAAHPEAELAEETHAVTEDV